MKLIKTFIVVIAGLSIATGASFAQEVEDKHKYLDFAVEVKNMHLWRGIHVTDAVTGTVDLGFTSRDKSFTFGVWAGQGANGVFREFDYYVQYSKAGFTIAVWDIYNYSTNATWYTGDAFNYKGRTSGHIIDVSVAYRFGPSFPLGLSWATIVLGRDRGHFVTNNGLPYPGAEKGRNLYSTYVYADYPILRHKVVNLDFGIGGAFALDHLKDANGDKIKSNFYAKKDGIVNIALTASKTLKLGKKYQMPVSATAMWNPTDNQVGLQLAVRLF